MPVSRYEDIPGHRSIAFHCDEDNCEVTLETGYSMWSYAIADAKGCGWYVIPHAENAGKWLHLCPTHGKAEWIRRKEAEKK